MERLQNLSQRIGNKRNAQKLPSDIVICSAKRTPLTKAKKGLLKDTSPQMLLQTCFEGVIKDCKIDPKLIEDIVVGNTLQIGAGEIPHRMALLLAGIPDSTSIVSINRQCSSGLEACAIIAAQIRAGQIQVGIGSGVEQLSMYDMKSPRYDPKKISPLNFELQITKNCMIPMGITSENVATQYGITREEQDQFALISHQRATAARKAGLFKEEILPLSTFVIDAENQRKEVVVTEDDGIREDVSLENLGKLKPAFTQEGSTTAGNSSQVTDGAAAVLLARRDTAEKLKLPILATFVDYTVVGVPPEIMGIGPAVAIPQLLKQNALNIEDIGIFEINQAFASQAYYSMKALNIPSQQVNPKGGAISLGHPLGCTGARLLATLIPELKRKQEKFGVVSMCMGTGMGAAALILAQD